MGTNMKIEHILSIFKTERGQPPLAHCRRLFERALTNPSPGEFMGGVRAMDDVFQHYFPAKSMPNLGTGNGCAPDRSAARE